MNIINTHVTLSTKDLAKTTALYQGIFGKELKFASDTASFLTINDNIGLMIMWEDFFKSFIPNKEAVNSKTSCEFRNTLTLDSKESVNELLEKALAAWAKEFGTADDGGDWFMYSRNFEDFDWHLRQILWMDMSQMPENQG